MTKYSVIYADPPWSFATYSKKGRGRCPDGKIGAYHYETMPLDQIKSLNVDGEAVTDICGKNAVLYLWATVPMLPHALEVIEAWGFAYKSGFVWVKSRIGTGYWARNRHELLLIAARGAGVCPARGTAIDSVIEHPQREHSRKPDEVYTIIERYHPDARKIELFARTQRPGWDAWGDQTDKFTASKG